MPFRQDAMDKVNLQSLADRFERIIADPEYQQAAQYCRRKGHCGKLLNVYDAGANHIPPDMLLDAAYALRSDTAFDICTEFDPHGVIKYCLRPFAERIPSQQAINLLMLFDEIHSVATVMVNANGDNTAKFYAAITADLAPEQAFSVLQETSIWKNTDFHDPNFIEWMEHMRPELMRIMSLKSS